MGRPVGPVALGLAGRALCPGWGRSAHAAGDWGVCSQAPVSGRERAMGGLTGQRFSFLWAGWELPPAPAALGGAVGFRNVCASELAAHFHFFSCL